MKRIAFIVVVVALGCGVAVPSWAQAPQLPPVNYPTPTPTPNSGAAVGSSERAFATANGETEMSWDPSSEQKSWEEFIADWMTPRKVEKSVILRIDEKYAYPHPAVSLKFEIVKEDDEFVWLVGIPPEDPESPLHAFWGKQQGQERIVKSRKDWEREHGDFHYWLDYGAEMVPPPFIDSLVFEAYNTGLPTGGLWQMSFARDDMDEDGIEDLVFPPSRQGLAQPSIYKGLGDGAFRLMREAGWLRGLTAARRR